MAYTEEQRWMMASIKKYRGIADASCAAWLKRGIRFFMRPEPVDVEIDNDPTRRSHEQLMKELFRQAIKESTGAPGRT